ncbi:hypothetical protein Vretifemale_12264 [Volvox reticuliferus]|uniref:Uncharacterized protein n=1 Tax=Volvox reticuliferus TaxID=1737510 RepID=A0A8J4CKF1_9CHLO|nr:hypothetical protein Vretifemale_12264 [Volvox reticuliferus]
MSRAPDPDPLAAARPAFPPPRAAPGPAAAEPRAAGPAVMAHLGAVQLLNSMPSHSQSPITRVEARAAMPPLTIPPCGTAFAFAFPGLSGASIRCGAMEPTPPQPPPLPSCSHKEL